MRPAPMVMPVEVPPSPPAADPAPPPDGQGEVITVTGSSVNRDMLTAVPSVLQSTEEESTEVGEEPDDLAGAAAQVAAPPALPVAVAASTPAPEQLVVQGVIWLQVEDPAATAGELRRVVERLGGRVVNEQIYGAAESWNGQLRLRLLPARVPEVVTWLEGQGEITSKQIQASDVSRTLVDQEIALVNLTTTLERLRKLLDGGGLSMQDILGVEREMTRLRGEIERIKGEKRWLQDRVALATLDVHVTRRESAAVMSAETKIYPGPRLAVLTLFDPAGRQRTRVGGGVAIHVVVPRITLELDVFDDVGDAASENRPAVGHAILATAGFAMYSDFLGRGRRRFLNPFLGLRAGYARLGDDAFALQADVGVELFKTPHALVDVSLRATGFLGEESEAGLVSSASVVFAF